MKFAGKVWRLLVGIKDGLVLILMLLFFAAIWGAMSARPSVGAGSGALLLKLDGPIVEQPSGTSAVEALQGTGISQFRLRDMVHALSLIHISSPRDPKTSRMPSSA